MIALHVPTWKAWETEAVLKKQLQIAGAIFALGVACSSASAQSFTFDFNSLENRNRDGAISDYMTAIYGSSVVTDGARVTDETSVPGGVTDLFIATSLQLLNRGDFEINFGAVPIISVQFEGHVLDPTPGDDFHLRAFNGNVEVFAYSRNEGQETFDSGLLTFPSPVDRLIFSDSGRKDVGVDDLTVQVVPEPATALLMLAGLTVGLVRRRHI
jgi:hypothetical protein